MKLSNKTYNTLKWLTTIVLPALGTLYFALSGIWGFPYGEQIVGTITALVTFLGVILGISSAGYYKEEPVNIEGLDYLEDGDDDEDEYDEEN